LKIRPDSSLSPLGSFLEQRAAVKHASCAAIPSASVAARGTYHVQAVEKLQAWGASDRVGNRSSDCRRRGERRPSGKAALRASAEGNVAMTGINATLCMMPCRHVSFRKVILVATRISCLAHRAEARGILAVCRIGAR